MGLIKKWISNKTPSWDKLTNKSQNYTQTEVSLFVSQLVSPTGKIFQKRVENHAAAEKNARFDFSNLRYSRENRFVAKFLVYY